MKIAKRLNKIKEQRKNRVRAKIFGTALQPRASIFRSNVYTYVQLIDDEAKRTLISGSTRSLKLPKKMSKTKEAEMLGEEIAKKAKENKIEAIVFDRGPYRFHGRVKAVYDGFRKGGIKC
jgi:large subunit ribosomal protein L18